MALFPVTEVFACESATPFAIKIQRILHYKQLPFSTSVIPSRDETALDKISSSRKLPVLQHGAKLIEASTQIAYFLEETYPSKPLVPQNSIDFARVHFLEEWAEEVLYRYRQYGEIKFGTTE